MNKLTLLRTKRNVSQRLLSEQTGISRVAITGLEAGNDVRWSTVQAVADYFNVSADYLMGRETPEVEAEFTTEELKLAYRFLRDLKKLHTNNKRGEEE